MSPKRKTTGIRVPDNPICQAILENLGNPIISTSAHLPEQDELSKLEKAELFDIFEKLVDIIIDDDQDTGYQVSSILDLTNDEPQLVRKGLGAEELDNLLVFS
jgi:tRNA threonylcarbamoyl adenosine modification protein (Sua5/YciO/YrdC/YwlC family)